MYQGAIQPDTSVLTDLKTEYLQTLSAPLDAYWEEALIGFADHYTIYIDGARSGYYCLNSNNQLVAFYLCPEYMHHGGNAFAYIRHQHQISAALAGTNDAYFLSLCLDVATKHQVHTLLFQENQTRDHDCIENRNLPPGTNQITDDGFHSKQSMAGDLAGGELYSFAHATDDDFADIVHHFAAASGSMDLESIETGFDDLKGYVRSVMDAHHIFILRKTGKLVATSECRISKTQKPYADIGMIVAAEHRRKGLGTDILVRTKAFCYEQGVRPICSCEVDNIGSKKAITKAGFVSRHRVVLFEFAVADPLGVD